MLCYDFEINIILLLLFVRTEFLIPFADYSTKMISYLNL